MHKIGHFKVDKKNARLFRSESEISIEPKLYQLLLLFIDNPDTVISRELIIEQIWDGRFVTDNAINKQVANLRKLLDDDPKKPEYIQTVPKLGYRLICPVEELVSETNTANNAFVTGNQNPLSLWLGVSLLCLLVLLGYFVWQPAETHRALVTEEVTRHSGTEHSARQIVGSSEILFLQDQLDSFAAQLWRQDLLSGDAAVVSTGKHEVSRLIAAKKYPDGQTQVFFLQRTAKSCEVFQSQLTVDNRLAQSEVLFNCDGQRIPDIALSPSGDLLIYAAAKVGDRVAQIYSFDLDIKVHQLLKQPEPKGRGNHALDISPDGQKLLIMSTDEARQTTLYVLHLDTNELVRYQSFPYYVSEAIWDHAAKGMYYFAAPPSHQIIHADLDGNNAQTIVSASDYVARDISRLGLKDILFSTRRHNFNNLWLNENNAGRLSNSSVYDILPSLFHRQDKYLFVSKRSGKSQLYLGDLKSGKSVRLSDFNQYLVLRYQELSPNDSQLLIADQNRVWQLSLDTKERSEDKVRVSDMTEVYYSENPITGLEWFNDRAFAVAVADKEQPLQFFVDNKPAIIQDIQRWIYLFSDHYNQRLLLIERGTNKLFSAESFAAWQFGSKLDDTGITLSERTFHPRVLDQKVYYMTRDKQGFKLNWQSLDDPGIKGEFSLRGYYLYDLAQSGTMISKLITVEGDIHRTASGN